ncbi:MAG: S-methyl-5'-thioadenosine phosphorylase, partial [Chloroflexi bacterium]|nr:S-methyl-5'-thioadenosine phosphorylase [Chloroflexota bacterium]
NNRANIYALKSLGVDWIIAVSACGSLREDFAPRDIVIPDQTYDRTKARINTFFGNGLVAHIGFADPFCPVLSNILYESVVAATTRPSAPDWIGGEGLGVRVHKGGTYVTIEGPQFSSKGESNIYRKLGMDLIGMTCLPEAKLAREAEICYATMAHITDYDVWHASAETVTVAMVVANLMANVSLAQEAIRHVVQRIPAQRGGCPCPTALKDAIMTSPERIPTKIKEDLALLVGRYV